MAIENGPVETVDLPIKSIVMFHSFLMFFVCLPGRVAWGAGRLELASKMKDVDRATPATPRRGPVESAYVPPRSKLKCKALFNNCC